MLRVILGSFLFMLVFLLKALSVNTHSTKFCMSTMNTIRARHKTCFLRPDTGPCRADIIQWYFDPRQSKCYRFFWGGCQGNGNKFESKDECMEHCYINGTSVATHIPYFCDLAFDYGTCFGHFERWAYDKMYKTCKRHIYSGCGGNQNNFETKPECYANCLKIPDNSMGGFHNLTTCIPLNVEGMHRRRRRR